MSRLSLLFTSERPTRVWLRHWILGALLLCGLLSPGHTQGTATWPGLRWQVDRNALALGEPLLVTLTQATGPGTRTLDHLDLQALREDFDIHQRTLGLNGRLEDLRLELFPRRTGTVPLALPGRPIGRREVTVTQGSAQTPTVQFRLYTEPAVWVERQPVRLVVEACQNGTLMFQRPVIETSVGLLLRPLNEISLEVERDGWRCSAQRWYWSLTPSLPGPHRVTPGWLQASHFGRTLRFPLPTADFKAEAVPAWLPLGLPVAPPQVQWQAPELTGQVGEPSLWRLDIEGAYNASTLKALVQAQLAPFPLWNRYPPEVRAVPSQNATPQWELLVYALPDRAAVLESPPLQLPWFSLQTQNLQHVEPTQAQFTVQDPTRERLHVLAQIATALAVLVLGLAGLWRRHGWRWLRHGTVQRIRRCTDIDSLQALLHEWRQPKPAGMHGRCPDMAWLSASPWTVPGLDGWTKRLERFRFGAAVEAEKVTVTALRDEALQCWKSARPMRG